MTVFSGPERRRRWSGEERLRILTEAFSPGAKVAKVAEVARRHDVSTALIYTWRRKHREARAEAASPELPTAGFAEAVMIVSDVAAASPSPAMVIELARGMQSLAAMVQQHFTKDPFAGDLWVFRGRSGALVTRRAA